MKKAIWAIVLMAMIAGALYTGCRNRQQQANGQDSITQTFLNGSDASGVESTTAENNEAAAKKKKWPKGMEIPAPMTGTAEQLLRRDGYTTSYNKDRKIPNWVAWHLTAAHSKGDSQRDDMMFTEDEDVPYPRATDDDYYNSRYDRGHMCPAGDNKWDRRAQMQTFLFTNICPQNHGLNKGDWNDLEIQCRYWARALGDIYIVTGPVFYHGVQKTIGRHQVAVPDAFFKVLLCDRGKAKAIGFIYPNRGGHKKMKEYVCPVDEIERITGIDFFPALDDRVENVVEAEEEQKMIDDWQVYKAKSYRNYSK